jgi:hypothetical protein
MKHEALKTLIKKQTPKGRRGTKEKTSCYQETTPKSVDASLEATKESNMDSCKGVKIIT